MSIENNILKKDKIYDAIESARQSLKVVQIYEQNKREYGVKVIKSQQSCIAT